MRRCARVGARAVPLQARVRPMDRTGSADLVERLLERGDAALDVVQLVEAEEAEPESLEFGALPNLQRHAGRGLQPHLQELLAVLDAGVGGVAHHHARRLVALGRHTGDAPALEQRTHLGAEFDLFGAHLLEAVGPVRTGAAGDILPGCRAEIRGDRGGDPGEVDEVDALAGERADPDTVHWAEQHLGVPVIDHWWQTNVEGFFAVGEVSASHGVYRPGGSALNAGQVGSTRAAQYIAAHGKGEPAAVETFSAEVATAVAEALTMGEAVLDGDDNVEALWAEAAKRMSRAGAAIRSRDGLYAAIAATKEELANFKQKVKISSPQKLSKVYRLYDLLLCQYVYLNAMADYIERGGKSRGSALYTDPDGLLPDESLPEIFRFTLDDGTRGDQVQEVSYCNGVLEFNWRKVRPLPKEDDFFENVWRSFRENGNVY